MIVPWLTSTKPIEVILIQSDNPNGQLREAIEVSWGTPPEIINILKTPNGLNPITVGFNAHSKVKQQFGSPHENGFKTIPASILIGAALGVLLSH